MAVGRAIVCEGGLARNAWESATRLRLGGYDQYRCAHRFDVIAYAEKKYRTRWKKIGAEKLSESRRSRAPP
jgi:hypothetical protein